MTWQTAISQPSELGESPFWHPDEQLLYWVDIPARQIHRAKVDMGTVESWAMPSEPGCIAPARTHGENAGLVMALRDGIYRARQWGGALELLAPALHDPATTRFNDGKADPLGRFWAGTLYEPRNAAGAQLFSLDGRGGRTPALELKAGNATTANGLAWSPDAAKLYWTDTPAHTIRAWDWDAETNVLSHERVFQQWPVKPEGWQPGLPGYGGRPDGAAVDVQGNYYVAMFEGARLLKLSPAGELLAEWAVPAQCPTMPCFGDADLKTLYLTTARHHRPAAELQRWPDSGCVLSMRVEVPGLPVNFFLD
jgi:sugar lactone lactonase YvrE